MNCFDNVYIFSSDKDAENGMFEINNDNAVIMQWTGLTDKNWVEIFEGDILEYPWYGDKYLLCPVVFKTGSFCFKRNDGSCGILQASRVSDCKVIGNIHENPELLKGGE